MEKSKRRAQAREGVALRGVEGVKMRMRVMSRLRRAFQNFELRRRRKEPSILARSRARATGQWLHVFGIIDLVLHLDCSDIPSLLLDFWNMLLFEPWIPLDLFPDQKKAHVGSRLRLRRS